MGGQMNLDSQTVYAAVNQIDIAIADIETRNKNFLAQIEEKNSRLNGKFGAIKTLLQRVEEEQASIQATIKACDEIKDALRRYEEQLREADDDSAFR